jgi:hypothetical protein
MILVSFFTNHGVPVTGLTPSISIVDISTGLVVDSGVMTETSAVNAPGWYNYDFVAYSNQTEYAMTADGGATLTGAERYSVASNELSSVEKSLDIIGGLMHDNAVLDSQTYDEQNNLETARLRSYDTRANAEAAGVTGLIHTFQFTAVYTSGLLSSYTVVREGS